MLDLLLHSQQKRRSLTLAAALALPFAAMCQPTTYSAGRVIVDSVEVIRLSSVSGAHKTEVSILPSAGNMAYEMMVNGKNIFSGLAAPSAPLKGRRAMTGNPLLAPWANRLDQQGFWANGKHYVFNPELGNVRSDQHNHPMHGLLSGSEWEVVAVRSDRRGAEVTSRFEFWKYPNLMAQFPFAHTIVMTYRLQDGALEVITRVENHSKEPMPLALGHHPFFQLYDAPRDEWRVHIPARDHFVVTPQLIPTGERKPVELPDPLSLAGRQLNDAFGNLVRDASGRAEFWVEGKREKISVIFGPKYPVAVVWAPPNRGLICFEPMAAVTNGYNLAHAGLYNELQSVPPGGVWQESFWIKPTGF